MKYYDLVALKNKFKKENNKINNLKKEMEKIKNLIKEKKKLIKQTKKEITKIEKKLQKINVKNYKKNIEILKLSDYENLKKIAEKIVKELQYNDIPNAIKYTTYFIYQDVFENSNFKHDLKYIAKCVIVPHIRHTLTNYDANFSLIDEGSIRLNKFYNRCLVQKQMTPHLRKYKKLFSEKELLEKEKVAKDIIENWEVVKHDEDYLKEVNDKYHFSNIF